MQLQRPPAPPRDRAIKRDPTETETVLLTLIYGHPKKTTKELASDIGVSSVQHTIVRLSNLGMVQGYVRLNEPPRLTEYGLGWIKAKLGRAGPYIPKRFRAPVPELCQFKDQCVRPGRSKYELCRTCENLRRAQQQRVHGMTPEQQQVLDFIAAHPGCTRPQIVEGLGIPHNSICKRTEALLEKKKAFRVKRDQMPRLWGYYRT